ncbi:aconitate hydratase AcnA [Oceanospirillum sanctuarii]|uniref:aconitate hydratase AcnA n=1 Tax=Oceanospirillum sanctuarii TaxID=1434821 RepID=UPI000A361471|nr:aconitate hydratase AcnA [Oceanospirillum sanctuarii]
MNQTQQVGLDKYSNIARLNIGSSSYHVVDIQSIAGNKFNRLPVVLRLLLENVYRNSEGVERKENVNAILSWLDTHTSVREIPYQPGRVLMHDTTSTPALVDIAGMRDALREAGTEPSVLRPTLHVDVAIDHSLAVEVFGKEDASSENMQHEIRRNGERYRFLRWAAGALGNVTIHPPGTGIMHTINLEQLATVVTTEERDGEQWMVPDMMLGTDSHTPMINGIGVLGWGVGGLEAQTVMFGMPTMIRVPDVIGVKFTGELSAGVQASDVALTVTHRLRQVGVTGEFVEFFGPGVANLNADARSVIANMAPEYGATTGYFPIDDHTLEYLTKTGRSDESVNQVRSYAISQGIWFVPDSEPEYSQVVEIDLSEIGFHAAGPKRPQDLVTLDQIPEKLREATGAEAPEAHDFPRFPVAIAAITSCTNTSDPSLIMAAGVVAQKASAFGLTVSTWVKTSLAPGSPTALSYLKRANLLASLESLGFGIVGYGCTTCIGNSGPLTTPIADSISGGECKPVAILSGNRNFPGRVHPDIDLSYIMSPALVVVYALAGNAEIDLSSEPIQISPSGQPIYLSDLWPTHEEINLALSKGIQTIDFKNDFEEASQNPLWNALESPVSDCFPWDESSNILRRPPFASLGQGSSLGEFCAYPLMVLGDDVTTDHISPASAIPKNSLVADYLVARGEDRNDLNVFASRRGNWEVMMRAAFHSKSLVNYLDPDMPVAHTLHVPSMEVMPIWEAAERYRQDGSSVVIIAGERYGMGSSRDWAAKGQQLLGVRAVVAASFERIHRSNLIGMGILPLCLPQGMSPEALAIKPGDQITINAPIENLICRGEVSVRILRGDHREDKITAIAAVETQLELELLRVGGVLPMILKRNLSRY